ncbi:hypothetical protein MLD38_021650 [Melastoma candidum]|uniref:Uncharacterized protein n=1 Tax=Melastoma candidum TaxID=119954 RepID=A0ACB9QGZ1_9MYRT|nr:hypothetical protein MLD38_021650 [Melastoma candidum]
MLTLGNRDVRKGFGVKDFGGEGEMEDVELEEGEACSYHDSNTKDEYSNCVDPDVSLSYIDAKIQNVLGHFQKDFEGGVSAEKLGAKFGGYGSFLENGEGSPICDTPRSLPPSHLEDGSRNHVTPLSVPLKMKPRVPPSRTLYPSRKQANTYDLVKQERALPPRGVEHVNSNDREEVKSAKSSDPRMLKVRIKVGSDNLSTQKKAAIYSGLGLDISPSTSVDCSPSESDGMLHEPQDVLIESPMSILQIMTSPSVHENLLLSPLQDDLILLTFNETSSEHRKDTSNADPISYRASENGSVPLRDKETALDGKKSGPKDRIDNIADVKNDNRMASLTGPGASFKKNMEMDTIDHEEVVSKALKLPSTSVSDKIVNLKKVMPNEGGSRFLGEKTLNDPGKEGAPESPLNEELGPSGMTKGYPGKLLQGKIANVDGPPRKNGIYPGTTHVESKTRSSSVEGNRAKSSECPTFIPSEVHDERVSYPELDNLPLASRKEKPPSKGKEKLKGSRTDETLGAVASRESMSGSSSATKSNKSVQLESSRPKSVGEDVKLKCPGKSRDKYKEFFGDLDGEGDNEDELMGVTHVGGLQELMGAGKGLNESLERVNVGSKKLIKLPKPTVSAPSGQSSELDNKHDVKERPIAPVVQTYMKEEVGDKYDEISAPVAPEVPPAPAAPVFIEDWVCCDKCQKWRLLPPGKNPDDFPEKWICSMLDWLPGMNRCSVSQEETTRALMALLQAPFPDAKKSEHLNFGAVVADTNAMRQLEVRHTYVGPPLPSSRGKKKPGSKGMSFPNKDGTQFSDTEKKQVQSAKSRSLDDVKPIPLRDVTDFEQPIMDHGLLGEKHALESKARVNHSDGGDLRNSKPHKRREADHDNRRTPKKLKNELKQHEDEDWISDDSKTTSRRVVECSPSVISSVSRKNRDLDEEGYLKKSKHEGAKRIQVSLKNIRGEGRVSVDRQSLDVGGSEDRDLTTEKRKIKDPQEAQECLEGTTERRQGSNVVLSQDNEHRKNKKPRLLKDEGKDPGIIPESRKIDKIGVEHMDQFGLGNQPSRWGINEVDSVQRKARSPMPSTAASSSSKVCSSPKSKSSFREMKGSPAESVSSSPIRSSKHDKQNLVPKNPLEKEVKIVSPRKCHDEDIIAPSNPFWTDRQEESATANHGSFGSSLVPDPDGSGFSASAKANGRHSVDAHSQKGRRDSRDALGPNKTEDSDFCLNGGRGGDPHHASQSHSHKSGKASFSRSRDQSKSSKHEGERDQPKDISYKLKEATALKETGNREGKPEIWENVHDDGRGKCSYDELGGKHGRASQSGNGQETKLTTLLRDGHHHFPEILLGPTK